MIRFAKIAESILLELGMNNLPFFWVIIFSLSCKPVISLDAQQPKAYSAACLLNSQLISMTLIKECRLITDVDSIFSDAKFNFPKIKYLLRTNASQDIINNTGATIYKFIIKIEKELSLSVYNFGNNFIKIGQLKCFYFAFLLHIIC